jgi:hypothetical protein
MNDELIERAQSNERKYIDWIQLKNFFHNIFYLFSLLNTFGSEECTDRHYITHSSMLKWRILVYISWADTDPLQDGHPTLPAGQHCCRGIYSAFLLHDFYSWLSLVVPFIKYSILQLFSYPSSTVSAFDFPSFAKFFFIFVQPILSFFSYCTFFLFFQNFAPPPLCLPR